MTPNEVFVGARNYLVKNGWRQHRSFEDTMNNTGAACILGALTAGAGLADQFKNGVPDTHPNFKTYGRAMEAVHDRLGGSVSAWNDRPERTVDDVLALLDELAHG